MKKILESSGSNIVILENNTARQYYHKKYISNRIITMYKQLKINENIIIDINIIPPWRPKSLSTSLKEKEESFCTKISITPSNYIVNMLDTEKDCIVWERLNTNKDKNIFQLLWDIGIAVNCFHKKGYIHNDCRLDNIGKRGSKFVLFDFDGTKNIKKDSFLTPSKDFKTLIQSVKFHHNKFDVYLSSSNFLNNILLQIYKISGIPYNRIVEYLMTREGYIDEVIRCYVPHYYV